MNNINPNPHVVRCMGHRFIVCIPESWTTDDITTWLKSKNEFVYQRTADEILSSEECSGCGKTGEYVHATISVSGKDK